MNTDSMKSIIANIISNWFRQWIGRRIFPKTKLRYQYNDRLSKIMDKLDDAMSHSKTCSMMSVINDARRSIAKRSICGNHQIDCQLKMAQILNDWYFEFKPYSNLIDFKHISKNINQFAKLLYKTHDVFNAFVQEIISDKELKNELKRNSSGYPTFEKIYNETTKDFEQLCSEASNNLKGEVKEYRFDALPKL